VPDVPIEGIRAEREEQAADQACGCGRSQRLEGKAADDATRRDQGDPSDVRRQTRIGGEAGDSPDHGLIHVGVRREEQGIEGKRRAQVRIMPPPSVIDGRLALAQVGERVTGKVQGNSEIAGQAAQADEENRGSGEALNDPRCETPHAPDPGSSGRAGQNANLATDITIDQKRQPPCTVTGCTSEGRKAFALHVAFVDC